jgi:hypothetical protein
MSPIRIILKAAKGPTGEYSSSWTLLPSRDENRAPSDLGGTPLSVARRAASASHHQDTARLDVNGRVPALFAT